MSAPPGITADARGTTWFPAPAKINLFLRVLGRRPDGYHDLQTLFRFLDYGDALAFTREDDGRILRVEPVPGVPEESDLCLRAARLLQRESGTRQGVAVRVRKRLPIGGGLGGGSSDAATTLIVLNALWGLGLDTATLQAFGLRLGADVPVFVFGRSALAEGVGERLEAVELPPAWYVVLVPPVQVSTARVFGHPELTRNSNRITMPAFFAGDIRNDLAAVVCREHPEVERLRAWLARSGEARITGSGGCVFAEFATERRAREVFDERPDGMKGFVAKGMDEHPLRGLILGSRQAG